MPERPDLEAALAEGLAEYRAGRFWEAHERWERVWHGRQGEERRWIQGLIMLAAAACQVERGRDRPARILLQRAAARLAGWDGTRDGALPGELAETAAAALLDATLPLPPVSLG